MSEDDVQVLAAITGGCSCLYEIVQATKITSRRVDRALQRLRKAGYIRYIRYGVGSGEWRAKEGGRVAIERLR